MLPGITNAMLKIDLHMAGILPPVIHVCVFEPPRIEAAKGVMAKEQRPAIRRAERQLDVVISAAIREAPALRPALVINGRIDRISRRGGGKDISNKAFVPATNFMAETETVIGAPMPGQHIASLAGVPVPFHVEPQAGDAVAQNFLGESVAIKILPGA